MSKPLSGKILERMAKDQQKEREEKQKALQDKVKQTLDWVDTQNWLLSDVVNVLQVISQTLQKTMESKTLPVIKEWNAKSFKEFYAETKPKEERKEEEVKEEKAV